jgi:hypothetical protein
MSIAIYRHLKLSVAVPIHREPNVVQLSRRKVHDFCLDQDAEGGWVGSIEFITISRRLARLNVYKQLWQVKNGQLLITHRTYCNGSLRSVTPPALIAPALTTVWTLNNDVASISKQFAEEQITSRVAIERYLHDHTPNPFDFKIIVMDFDPNKQLMGRPYYTTYLVRTRDKVERMAIFDHSEDSNAWAKLFLT